MARRVPLPFDPIEEAARQWGLRWKAVPEMRAVTSLMRVQQLVLAELDEILRPHGLTFARYEALVLLTFSRRGELPLGKMGERLQVHPTSVTSIVDRLEAQGLVRRHKHPTDGRGILAAITDEGRALVGDRGEHAAPIGRVPVPAYQALRLESVDDRRHRGGVHLEALPHLDRKSVV